MRLLRWLAWRWYPCSTCEGSPAYTWGEPWGCWDCQNMGETPEPRWLWLSRRVSWRGVR